MTAKDVGFRARAASLFRSRAPSITFSTTNEKNRDPDPSTASEEPPLSEKAGHLNAGGKSPSLSSSGRPPQVSVSDQEPREKGIRLVRTVPGMEGHSLEMKAY